MTQSTRPPGTCPPRVHKWHFWAHVRPKGKRVDYAVPRREDGSDPIDDESNCFVDPADEDVWEPGYVDPRGISVEPNEEDGFVMDMDDHEYDSDEDTVHIEVEDIRRQLKGMCRKGWTWFDPIVGSTHLQK